MARNRDNFFGRPNRDNPDMDRRNQQLYPRRPEHDRPYWSEQERERRVRGTPGYGYWEPRHQDEEYDFRDRDRVEWNQDRDFDRNRNQSYFGREDFDRYRNEENQRYQRRDDRDRFSHRSDNVYGGMSRNEPVRENTAFHHHEETGFGSPLAGAPSPTRPIQFGGRPQERSYNDRDFDDRGYNSRMGGQFNERGMGNQSMGGHYNERGMGSQHFGSNERQGFGNDINPSFNQESSGNMMQNRNRGPKNYQRSDDRLREDVCDRIMHQSNLDAGDVEIKVQNGEVTLSGSIPNKQTKRMIEDIAESVLGVKEVNNQLRVARFGMQNENKESTTSTSATTTKNNTTNQSSRSRHDAE